MTAKKAKAPKVEEIGNSDSAPTFDPTSAEAADVGQGDAEFQTIGAEEVGKIEDIIGDALPPPPPDVPAYSGIEQRLGELEKKQADTASLLSGGFAEFGEENRRLEEQVNKKAPEELGEWIADVESKQGQRLAVLESQLSDLVVEHHDRLLQLEMKVTAQQGEDEVGPGPG